MDWLETARTHRRALHQMPELGFHEEATRQYLLHALKSLGLSPQTLAKTGLIADIQGNRPGRCVALRSDIDALPLNEETGLPFSSKNPGRMHACGHDGHMSMLLTAATHLTQNPDFPGTVRLIFQPSEEQPPGGAPDMIAQGCLDGVDEIYGLH
ncbi:MAG: amidohydrolase, partial [Firmicutes bacterium]|nr:amidohydrolase [Bacillota bacterium]